VNGVNGKTSLDMTATLCDGDTRLTRILRHREPVKLIVAAAVERDSWGDSRATIFTGASAPLADWTRTRCATVVDGILT
jgi:hypothetical protein